jgi:hypothetical protein
MEEQCPDIKSNVTNLELYSDNYPFSLALRISNFENEAEYKKFVNNCKNMIRKSIEYKLWRKYIVDILGVDKCMITQEHISQLQICVHHNIPSMSMLIKALVNKKLTENKNFCTFDICTEAIELHFKNKIGYVTLIESMHEKFHNGFLSIPISLVRGDYNYFIENYSKYLDESDIEEIQARLSVTESNVDWSKDHYKIAVGDK